MQHRFLLTVAFPLAVSLAACSGDSASAPDAAPVPDAPVQRDTTTSADLRVTDLAADNARAPDLAADNVPSPDLARDAGCAGWTSLQRLQPADAKALIETSDTIVINVHIPYEGDVPGTDTSIPYNDVKAIDAYLQGDHCADVLLVCKSGGMSKTAGDQLVNLGYLRVRDLAGGMVAWEQAGYALLKDGGL